MCMFVRSMHAYVNGCMQRHTCKLKVTEGTQLARQCMHLCMYVCIYMYVDICMYVCMRFGMYVCKRVRCVLDVC